ncbi:OmpL47-type beta-barrel domain-containing protein [Labilibacter marinus]|uniref:OmpL47-type beta-barrel domain-containing protein n=1 Tax=Labilibacter marinus TaxID=1477105 RepID=UPI00117A8BEE|nr:hypothetical protein [Labilibacter marinus]
MKTTIQSLIYMVIIAYSMQTYAQKPILPEPTNYVDSVNRYYMQAELPVYLSISNSPDSKGKTIPPSNSKERVNEKKPIYMDGHGIHKIRHMDGPQGNTLDAFVIYADGIAPKTILKFNDALRYKTKDKIYYAPNMSAELIAKDELSGVKNTYLSVNKTMFNRDDISFEPNNEGDYLLQYYSTDQVGNAEGIQKYNFTIDLSPPKSYYNIVGIAKGNIISTSTRLYLTSTDSLSGISAMYWYFDKDEPKLYAGNDLPVAQLQDGYHTVNYYAIDNVGNTAKVEQLEFYLDKTAPIVSADVLGDKFIVGDKVYYSSRTKLKLTAVDNKSGIKDVLYAVDNNDFMPYKDPFYLPNQTGKHTVRYFARDNVSNDKNHSEYKHIVGIVYVDLTGPTLSYKYNGPSFKKGNMKYISSKTDIVFNGFDGESGLKNMKYMHNGSEEMDYTEPINIKDDGLHQMTIVGYDNVNNRNVENFEFTVDNVPSDIFVTYSASPTDTINNVPVYPSYTSIFLAGTDAGTECDKIFYSINKQTLKPYNNKISGFKKNTDIELKIVAEDKLKNTSEIIITFKTNDL